MLNKITKHADALHALGAEVVRMRFSYEAKNDTRQRYWKERIREHQEYFEKSSKYYKQACLLMEIVRAEQYGEFLLALDKFSQLKKQQMTILEKIKENTTVMMSDRQQSRWSKDLKREMIENSNRCLEHEKRLSDIIKEFVGSHFKDRTG